MTGIITKSKLQAELPATYLYTHLRVPDHKPFPEINGHLICGSLNQQSTRRQKCSYVSLLQLGSPEGLIGFADFEQPVSQTYSCKRLRKQRLMSHRHNPLGKVFSTDELLAIGRMCVRNSLILVSDEVYEHLSFQNSFARVATLDDSIGACTLTAGSLGKLFNATGWRIGFIIGPQHLVKYVQNAHIIVAYASSSPAQKAAAVGLRVAEKNGFWQTNLKDVQRRVGRICEVLRELGIPVGFVSKQETKKTICLAAE